ncbi:hypothetical protein RHSIM_Rhsim01G0064800 [Rhododendron simsii]|uniref:Glycosyltransferase N-terminal domain-containing protein n=1 Tax=Rhododendron simsii TaxID=118357 RepID=A0A834M2J2_RHOSS|nr:hypothetical protein RHSIM_Rhsim01G0064800 [Rhododendron simsii]
MAVNGDKPHVVCMPYPAQSHMKAMLKLAKLLHHEGFHITFVNTEYYHKRFLRVRGPNSLDGLPDFRFETIPDGLPPSDPSAPQDMHSLLESIRKNALEAPFLSLVSKLNDSSASGPDVPPVTCIVSDGFMSFTITAGEDLGIPVIVLYTLSACGFMGFYQFRNLQEKGLTPLKENALEPFLSLVSNLNDTSALDVPPVTCIVSDGFMSFTVTAGEGLGIPVVVFFTLSACGFMGFYQFRNLLERGLTPLKVIGLDLSCSWLQGAIHPNNSLFLSFPHLQKLNLAYNGFSMSHIPPEFARFPELTHLDLSHYEVSGKVPLEVFFLNKLVSLDLSFNSDLTLEEGTSSTKPFEHKAKLDKQQPTYMLLFQIQPSNTETLPTSFFLQIAFLAPFLNQIDSVKIAWCFTY